MTVPPVVFCTVELDQTDARQLAFAWLARMYTMHLVVSVLAVVEADLGVGFSPPGPPPELEVLEVRHGELSVG
jgi:hypothetical protein